MKFQVGNLVSLPDGRSGRIAWNSGTSLLVEVDAVKVDVPLDDGVTDLGPPAAPRHETCGRCGSAGAGTPVCAEADCPGAAAVLKRTGIRHFKSVVEEAPVAEAPGEEIVERPAPRRRRVRE